MKDEAETARPARRTRTRKGGDKPPAAPRATRGRRGASTPSTGADAAAGTETGSGAINPAATGTPVIPLRPGDAGGALDTDASDLDPATGGIEALHVEDGGGTPIIPLRQSIGSDAGDVSSGPTAAEAAGIPVLESLPPADATAGVRAVAAGRTTPGGAGTTSSIRTVAGNEARSAPAGPTRVGGAGDRRTGRFKERALRTARLKFADDPVRSPLTSQQLDVILDLLHEPGKDRTLVSSTWTYLERGMSYAHASVTADKLRGTFRGDRAAA
ncbi:MAG TPA: hypothetical protein VLK84_04030 [Longimicrobium sp.]|nr:hypothetical protein [Longimicrobium sp.]